jgi:hypothetical protein
MSDGFKILAESTSNQLLEASNKVDIVIISYAFHHVPDGKALRNYLSAPPVFKSDLWRYLSSSDPESKRLFTTDLKNALNKYIKESGGVYEPTMKLLPVLEFFGPVRTLWYNLNWQLLSNKEIFQSFKDFINRDFPRKCFFTEEWLGYITNARLNLLSYIAKILQPNGLLLIADPDGTGKFNQTRWTYDAEATTANFWTRGELEKEIQEGFFGLKVLKSENVVKDKDTNELVSTPDSGDRLEKWNLDDMGYVLVAQKV